MNPDLPCNPSASPAARALYALLHKVSGKYLLTGQHNFIHSRSRYTDRVQFLTGKRPLIWGSDFSFACTGPTYEKHRHRGPLNLTSCDDPSGFLLLSPHEAREALVREAIARHKEGHLITLMWHHPFPTYGDAGPGESVWAMQNRPDAQTWAQLTTPGTVLYERWCAQVDTIAIYLRQLRDAEVPVLWRPYHEFNGVWFWWCNQPGPGGLARLWRNLYERYTTHHGLHNLLWVWNANAPRQTPGDEAFAYQEFFPGHDCVDVLAADVYRRDYLASHHDDLAALAASRPIALGEVGELPDLATIERQRRWAWFMPWGWLVEKRNTLEQIRALYHHPRVLSLEDRLIL